MSQTRTSRESFGNFLDEKAEVERRLKESQQCLSNRDILIGILQNQLKQMESNYKRSIDEMQKMRFKYLSAVQQLSNLKKICEKLEDDTVKQDIGKRNGKYSCPEMLNLKNELEKWKSQYGEILSKVGTLNTDECGCAIQRDSKCPQQQKETKPTTNTSQESLLRSQVNNIENLIRAQSDTLNILISKMVQCSGVCKTEAVKDIVPPEIDKQSSLRTTTTRSEADAYEPEAVKDIVPPQIEKQSSLNTTTTRSGTDAYEPEAVKDIVPPELEKQSSLSTTTTTSGTDACETEALKDTATPESIEKQPSLDTTSTKNEEDTCETKTPEDIATQESIDKQPSLDTNSTKSDVPDGVQKQSSMGTTTSRSNQGSTTSQNDATKDLPSQQSTIKSEGDDSNGEPIDNPDVSEDATVQDAIPKHTSENSSSISNHHSTHTVEDNASNAKSFEDQDPNKSSSSSNASRPVDQMNRQSLESPVNNEPEDNSDKAAPETIATPHETVHKVGSCICSCPCEDDEPSVKSVEAASQTDPNEINTPKQDDYSSRGENESTQEQNPTPDVNTDTQLKDPQEEVSNHGENDQDESGDAEPSVVGTATSQSELNDSQKSSPNKNPSVTDISSQTAPTVETISTVSSESDPDETDHPDGTTEELQNENTLEGEESCTSSLLGPRDSVTRMLEKENEEMREKLEKLDEIFEEFYYEDEKRPLEWEPTNRLSRISFAALPSNITDDSDKNRSLYKANLEEIDKYKGQLYGSIADKDETIVLLQAEVDNLKKCITESQIADAGEEVTQKLNDLQEIIREKDMLITDLKNEIQLNYSAISENKKNIGIMEQDILAKQNELTDLEKCISEKQMAEKELLDVQSQIKRLEEIVALKELTIVNLGDQLQQAMASFEQLKNENNEAERISNSDLRHSYEDKLDSLEKERDELHRMLTELQEERTNNLITITELRNVNAEDKTRIQECECSLKNNQEEMDGLVQELEELKNKCKFLLAEQEENVNEIDKLNRTLQKQEAYHADTSKSLQDENVTLESDMEDLKKINDKLAQKELEFVKKITELENIIEDYKKQLSTLQHTVRAGLSCECAKKCRRDGKGLTCECMTSTKQRIPAEVTTTRINNVGCQCKIREKIMEKQQCQNQYTYMKRIQELEIENAKLKEQLEAGVGCQCKIREKITEKQQCQNQYTYMKRIQELETENGKLKEQLEAGVTKSATEIKEHNQVLNEEILTLRNEMEKYKDKLESLQEKSDTRYEIQSKNDEIETHSKGESRQITSEMNSSVLVYQEKIAKLEIALKGYEERTTGLQNDLEEKNYQLEELNQLLETSKCTHEKDLKQMSNDIEKLSFELQLAQEAEKQKTNEIERLQLQQKETELYYEKKYSTLNEEINAYENMCSCLKIEAGDMKKSLDSAQDYYEGRIAKLNEEVEACQLKCFEVEKIILETKGHYEGQITMQSQDIERLQFANRSLQTKEFDQSLENEKLKGQLYEVELNYQRLISDLKKQQQPPPGDWSDAADTYDHMKEITEKLSKDLMNCEEKKACLMDDINDKQNKINVYQMVIETNEKKVRELEDVNKQLQTEIQQIVEENQANIGRIGQLSETVNSITKAFETRIGDYENQIKKLEKCVDKCKTNKRNIDVNKEPEADTTNELNKKITDLVKERDEQEKLINDLNTQLTSSSTVNKEKSQELIDLVEKYKTALKDCETDIKSMNVQLRDMYSEEDKWKREKKALEDKLEIQATTMEQYKSDLAYRTEEMRLTEQKLLKEINTIPHGGNMAGDLINLENEYERLKSNYQDLLENSKEKDIYISQMQTRLSEASKSNPYSDMIDELANTKQSYSRLKGEYDDMKALYDTHLEMYRGEVLKLKQDCECTSKDSQLNRTEQERTINDLHLAVMDKEVKIKALEDKLAAKCFRVQELKQGCEKIILDNKSMKDLLNDSIQELEQKTSQLSNHKCVCDNQPASAVVDEIIQVVNQMKNSPLMKSNSSFNRIVENLNAADSECACGASSDTSTNAGNIKTLRNKRELLLRQINSVDSKLFSLFPGFLQAQSCPLAVRSLPDITARNRKPADGSSFHRQSCGNVGSRSLRLEKTSLICDMLNNCELMSDAAMKMEKLKCDLDTVKSNFSTCFCSDEGQVSSEQLLRQEIDHLQKQIEETHRIETEVDELQAIMQRVHKAQLEKSVNRPISNENLQGSRSSEKLLEHLVSTQQALQEKTTDEIMLRKRCERLEDQLRMKDEFIKQVSNNSIHLKKVDSCSKKKTENFPSVPFLPIMVPTARPAMKACEIIKSCTPRILSQPLTTIKDKSAAGNTDACLYPNLIGIAVSTAHPSSICMVEKNRTNRLTCTERYKSLLDESIKKHCPREECEGEIISISDEDLKRKYLIQ